jgi:ribonuclease E
MSRQRLRPSLQERWTQDVASLSTAVLRLIEEEASKKKSGEVRAIVSSDMSIFLLNERRARINEIEERTDVRVVVVSDPTRSDNRFEVNRLKKDDKKGQDHASYEIQSEIGNNDSSQLSYKKPKFEKPAVNLTPPKKPKKKGDNFIKKIFKALVEPQDTQDINPKKKPSKQRRARINEIEERKLKRNRIKKEKKRKEESQTNKQTSLSQKDS